MKSFLLLCWVFVTSFIVGCTKDVPIPLTQATNNNLEYIKGKFDTTYMIFSYKPVQLLTGVTNAVYDTNSYSSHSQYKTSINAVGSISLRTNNIDFTIFNYPDSLPYSPNPVPFGNDHLGDISLSKKRSDGTNYNYNLMPSSNSQIILDSYDKVNSILTGRFSGKLYGTIVAEYIGPITDSITVSNGEFCIKLNKQ